MVAWGHGCFVSKQNLKSFLLLFPVHDGAARLPNGEGTRNDICELLKDSQFLAPGVTESQVCL